MNKYIKFDVINGLTYLKCAIMNALADIESGEESKITLGKHVPVSYVIACAKERGWILDEDSLETNGWEHDCWINMFFKDKTIIIEGCLCEGQPTVIICDNE